MQAQEGCVGPGKHTGTYGTMINVVALEATQGSTWEGNTHFIID